MSTAAGKKYAARRKSGVCRPQTAQIRQGDNKLELIVRENTLNDYTHSTGGPAVDCVKIVTDAGLDWESLTENLDHVGQVRG